MSCNEFWESGTDNLDHLRECARCAALFEQEKHIAVGLKALGAQWRRREAPVRVERGLLEAFRVEMGVAPAPRRAGWFPVLTWAAAMAAMVVLALILLHGRQPEETNRPSRNGVEVAANPETPYTVEVTAGLNDFVPLPNAEQLDPGDEMDVVRMEMPRSTLLAMGLPVAEEDGMVQADVLLGGDGVARAVRVLD